MGHRDGRHKALYAAKTVPFTVPKGLLTGLGEALPLFCNESNENLTMLNRVNRGGRLVRQAHIVVCCRCAPDAPLT